ncbi:unnamed protein product [Mytilus coruscus]|uniref:Uncharacterized protein n=1 Tax=Mytilus coruscus TaxID=42192 RepID=A0A6J8CMD1_MYTCO|nr:unnamed protein product [Mytilus coruscus]
MLYFEIKKNACIICNNKSYKKDKKLIKIESDDRVGRILSTANHFSDFHLISKISQVDFKEKAFYHNQCTTKYLVGIKEVDEEPCSENISDYQIAFSKLVSEIRKDLIMIKKAFLLTSLLEIFFSYFPENVCVNGKVNTVDDICLFLRLLSRDIIDFPVHNQRTGQTVPFWTGFNCLLSEKNTNVAGVAYPPIIDAKPTDMSTVFTAMKKCLDMSNEAGQAHAIQTFDQQLYAIA